MRPKPISVRKAPRPGTPDKLFAQVILSAQSQVLKLWEEGDRLITKNSLQCDDEIQFEKSTGRSYYQCQPHFWQCFWSGKTSAPPALKIDLFGQTFTVKARAAFAPIPVYSNAPRFYQIIKGPAGGLNFHYGVQVELEVVELPGNSWPIILTDTCRDSWLPQRIYSYSTHDQKKEEGLHWDNFDRNIFIDRFYVSNQQVNEWKLLIGQEDKVIKDRKLWPSPALLNRDEQVKYCNFWGKRVLEAKLFQAAAMPPSDFKNPLATRIIRYDTPWQRDHSKSFLGIARINQDYQLTPLDCQLAQVKGCENKLFTTDSVSWMGMNFPLGFFPEHLINYFQPSKNLKTSSQFIWPSAEDHQLGFWKYWKGSQSDYPVAFRCYEEVSL
jgi:hypothetical protein